MVSVVNSISGDRLWKISFMDKFGVTYKEAELEFIHEFKNYKELIYPENARLIYKICIETSCKVVWSSSWRFVAPYKDDIKVADKMLQRRGVTPTNTLIDYTPKNTKYDRSAEIKKWLIKNKSLVDIAAVVDDMDVVQSANDYCTFKTDSYYGINNETAENIIKYFKGRR